MINNIAVYKSKTQGILKVVAFDSQAMEDVKAVCMRHRLVNKSLPKIRTFKGVFKCTFHIECDKDTFACIQNH